MITGQNGILNTARRAADETTRAELIEEARRAIIEQVAENEGDNISKEQLHDILVQYFDGIPDVYTNTDTKEENEAWANEFPKNFPSAGADGKLTTLKGPYEDVENVTIYDIFTGKFGDGSGETGGGSSGGGSENGEPGGGGGTGGGTPTEGAVDAEKIAEDVGAYIGDYVEYGVDLDSNPETPDWRVFYAENGRIFLIAADYVPTSHSAMATVKSSTELDVALQEWSELGIYEWSKDLCFDWGMAGPSTFSPIPESPAGFLTIVKHNMYSLTDHQGNRNSKAASQLLNTEAWSGFKTGKAEFAIGGPTIEMWCASWNAVLDKKGESETDFKKIEVDEENTATAEYGYYLKSTDTGVVQQEGIKVNGATDGSYVAGAIDGLPEELATRLESEYGTFWPHVGAAAFGDDNKVTANGATGTCWGYWLASPMTQTSLDWNENKETGLRICDGVRLRCLVLCCGSDGHRSLWTAFAQ